ncbi:MAG: hypothetical protein IKV68_05235 [Oscillospiraceae bacterium]|nr:hypothetical protein [Oscillospiraceae bacterium]
MNRRYVLQNDSGKLFTCVISPNRSEDDQWCAIFAIQKGYGFTAERWGDKVKIVDYFHGDTRAEFTVVSVEDTTEESSATLAQIEE